MLTNAELESKFRTSQYYYKTKKDLNQFCERECSMQETLSNLTVAIWQSNLLEQ